MQTMKQISLKEVTRLPIVELVKTDGVGKCVIVKTPHKGNVHIDYQEEVGFFTRQNKEKLFTNIVARILTLEEESKAYLLQEWINTQ